MTLTAQSASSGKHFRTLDKAESIGCGSSTDIALRCDQRCILGPKRFAVAALSASCSSASYVILLCCIAFASMTIKLKSGSLGAVFAHRESSVAIGNAKGVVSAPFLGLQN